MNIWVARLPGSHFPWHTPLINILGSIVMGLITGWFAERFGAAGHLRLFLATGIMGGFTTFSAFLLDAALLLERQARIDARSGGRRPGGGSRSAGLVLALWIRGAECWREPAAGFRCRRCWAAAPPA